MANKTWKDEVLWIRCADCGHVWSIDLEPTPDGCVDKCWTLGIASSEHSAIEWGSTVDPEGNLCS